MLNRNPIICEEGLDGSARILLDPDGGRITAELDRFHEGFSEGLRLARDFRKLLFAELRPRVAAHADILVRVCALLTRSGHWGLLLAHVGDGHAEHEGGAVPRLRERDVGVSKVPCEGQRPHTIEVVV